MDNPSLNLKNINDLEAKMISNSAVVKDYEHLDYFISSIGGNTNYIKNIIVQNGFRDYDEYIRLKTSNSEGTKIQLAKIYGSIMGALSVVKSYALKNNF